MNKVILTISLLLLFFCANAQRQELSSNTTKTETDSTLVVKKNKRNGFLQIFSGKPGKAALYSLLVPGGGQLYNRKYWKVPIAIGLDVGTFMYARYYHNLYNDFDDAFFRMLADPDLTFNGYTSASNVKLRRDAFRQQMEYGYVYLGIAHLITILDAFVDRHLMNFDISDDLSIKAGHEQLFLADRTINISSLGFNINLSKSQKKLKDYKLISP